MKTLIFLLMLPLISFSQTNEYEKFDSLKTNDKTYRTYFFNQEKSSYLNSAKVFVVNNKDFESVVKKLPKIYSSSKQEFTDYYVIAMDKVENEVITEYLNQIDYDREKRDKPTFLKIFTFDLKSHKHIYSSEKKNIARVSDLHYLNSPNDICKYLVCRK